MTAVDVNTRRGSLSTAWASVLHFVSASDYIRCERLLGGPGSPVMERIDINLLAEIRLAAKRLKGAARRSWFAWACNNYASGSPRAAETIFGWNRKAVARGLSELDSGTG